jgi:hypothetical protein
MGKVTPRQPARKRQTRQEADAAASNARAILEHDENLTAEQRQVCLWRFDQLVLHGYPALSAAWLAAERTVDLETARQLAIRGCPPELATKILT